MKKIIVCLILVMAVAVPVVAQDFVFVTESGQEIPLEEMLKGSPELSNVQLAAIFSGVIVGVIGSTIIPHYTSASGRNEPFDWSYGWNALLSSIATALLLATEMPSTADVWYCFIIALLTQSGIKRLGDVGIDKSRKNRGG